MSDTRTLTVEEFREKALELGADMAAYSPDGVTIAEELTAQYAVAIATAARQWKIIEDAPHAPWCLALGSAREQTSANGVVTLGPCNCWKKKRWR